VRGRSWSRRGRRTRGVDIEKGARARIGEARESGLGTGHARVKAATCACGVAGIRVMWLSEAGAEAVVAGQLGWPLNAEAWGGLEAAYEGYVART
jgi:uncharacterized protein YqkB